MSIVLGTVRVTRSRAVAPPTPPNAAVHPTSSGKDHDDTAFRPRFPLHPRRVDPCRRLPPAGGVGRGDRYRAHGGSGVPFVVRAGGKSLRPARRSGGPGSTAATRPATGSGKPSRRSSPLRSRSSSPGWLPEMRCAGPTVSHRTGDGTVLTESWAVQPRVSKCSTRSSATRRRLSSSCGAKPHCPGYRRPESRQGDSRRGLDMTSRDRLDHRNPPASGSSFVVCSSRAHADHERHRSRSIVITGPGGRLARYCGYLRASASIPAAPASVSASCTVAMPSMRIHHSWTSRRCSGRRARSPVGSLRCRSGGAAAGWSSACRRWRCGSHRRRG